MNKNHDAAIIEFDKSIVLDGTSPKLFIQKAESLFEKGETKKGCNELEFAMPIGSLKAIQL